MSKLTKTAIILHNNLCLACNDEKIKSDEQFKNCGFSSIKSEKDLVWEINKKNIFYLQLAQKALSIIREGNVTLEQLIAVKKDKIKDEKISELMKKYDF